MNLAVSYIHESRRQLSSSFPRFVVVVVVEAATAEAAESRASKGSTECAPTSQVIPGERSTEQHTVTPLITSIAPSCCLKSELVFHSYITLNTAIKLNLPSLRYLTKLSYR